MRLRIATRGSALALWQAHQVRDRLARVHEGLEIEIVEVRTEGDRDQRARIEALSATGVFTKEVDDRILAGDAEIAVHSLKDQLTTLPEGVVLGMVLTRGPVEDVLVGRAAPRLDQLAAGARIATGSLRRAAQLRRLRSDLEVVGIRGNVETRLAKLDAGDADAIVLARAGLERLGLAERITEVLGVDAMLPAVSQGIVGITCLEDQDVVRELLLRADDPQTHAAARAERALLRSLHGGCNVPLGAHATVAPGGGLQIRARVLSPDGSQCLEGCREGSPEEAEAIGIALAAELSAQGADALIEAARG